VTLCVVLGFWLSRDFLGRWMNVTMSIYNRLERQLVNLVIDCMNSYRDRSLVVQVKVVEKLYGP
jgi:hypothetical protein